MTRDISTPVLNSLLVYLLSLRYKPEFSSFPSSICGKNTHILLINFEITKAVVDNVADIIRIKVQIMVNRIQRLMYTYSHFHRNEK